MSETNAAAEERDRHEHQADLDAQELRELEQAEYYAKAPAPAVEPARRRTLFDRLLRRSR